jgi:hypothetical protein
LKITINRILYDGLENCTPPFWSVLAAQRGDLLISLRFDAHFPNHVRATSGSLMRGASAFVRLDHSVSALARRDRLAR